MKNRYKYHLYDCNNQLKYSSKFDYESQLLAESIALTHLNCFKLGGDLIGGYIEYEEV